MSTDINTDEVGTVSSLKVSALQWGLAFLLTILISILAYNVSQITARIAAIELHGSPPLRERLAIQESEVRFLRELLLEMRGTQRVQTEQLNQLIVQHQEQAKRLQP